MSAQVTTLVDGFTFTEGPRWRDGDLYFADFYTQAVWKMDGSDHTVSKVVEVPERPSGIGWLPDGRLLVVSQHDRTVQQFVDGTLKTYSDLAHLCGGNPNDMLVLPDGTAYVGDLGMDPSDIENIGYGTLIRIDPDGTPSTAYDKVRFPNGIVRASDGRIVVAESFGNRLTAFDVADDGSLSNRSEWASFGPESDSRSLGELVAAAVVAPDGIAIDSEDHIWVADCFHSRVIRVREGGEIVEQIDIDGLQAYAVALGGEDLKDLYICAAGSPLEEDAKANKMGAILHARVDVAGVTS